MYNSWDKDLSDSVKAFYRIKDTILPKIISGKIVSIEESKDDIILMLDRYAGVDYIRQNKIGIQGIASRCQWGKAWNTFTIRSKRHSGTDTELNKRLTQIKEGYFYPSFTMQAYFDNRKDNNLLSIGIIKTVDLYSEFTNNKHKFKKRSSDNDFYFVNWSDISNIMKKYEITELS